MAAQVFSSRVYGRPSDKNAIAIVGVTAGGQQITDIVNKFDRDDMIECYRACGIEVHGVVRRKGHRLVD